MKSTLKALCAALIASIIAVGCFAVHLTHVYCTMTVTFGDAPAVEQKATLADAIDVAQLHPLPIREPNR